MSVQSTRQKLEDQRLSGPLICVAKTNHQNGLLVELPCYLWCNVKCLVFYIVYMVLCILICAKFKIFSFILFKDFIFLTHFIFLYNIVNQLILDVL